MLDLSMIFPEVGSFTGSDIISWVIGSKNSSGGYKNDIVAYNIYMYFNIMISVAKIAQLTLS